MVNKRNSTILAKTVVTQCSSPFLQFLPYLIFGLTHYLFECFFITPLPDYLADLNCNKVNTSRFHSVSLFSGHHQRTRSSARPSCCYHLAWVCPVHFHYTLFTLLYVQMITMPGCTDSICKTCFTQYLTMVVRNLEVKHYNCPVCGMPNMADREAANDMYLQILVAMVSTSLKGEDGGV